MRTPSLNRGALPPIYKCEEKNSEPDNKQQDNVVEKSIIQCSETEPLQGHSAEQAKEQLQKKISDELNRQFDKFDEYRRLGYNSETIILKKDVLSHLQKQFDELRQKVPRDLYPLLKNITQEITTLSRVLDNDWDENKLRAENERVRQQISSVIIMPTPSSYANLHCPPTIDETITVLNTLFVGLSLAVNVLDKFSDPLLKSFDDTLEQKVVEQAAAKLSAEDSDSAARERWISQLKQCLSPGGSPTIAPMLDRLKSVARHEFVTTQTEYLTSTAASLSTSADEAALHVNQILQSTGDNSQQQKIGKAIQKMSDLLNQVSIRVESQKETLRVAQYCDPNEGMETSLRQAQWALSSVSERLKPIAGKIENAVQALSHVNWDESALSRRAQEPQPYWVKVVVNQLKVEETATVLNDLSAGLVLASQRVMLTEGPFNHEMVDIQAKMLADQFFPEESCPDKEALLVAIRETFSRLQVRATAAYHADRVRYFADISNELDKVARRGKAHAKKISGQYLNTHYYTIGKVIAVVSDELREISLEFRKLTAEVTTERPKRQEKKALSPEATALSYANLTVMEKRAVALLDSTPKAFANVVDGIHKTLGLLSEALQVRQGRVVHWECRGDVKSGRLSEDEAKALGITARGPLMICMEGLVVAMMSVLEELEKFTGSLDITQQELESDIAPLMKVLPPDTEGVLPALQVSLAALLLPQRQALYKQWAERFIKVAATLKTAKENAYRYLRKETSRRSVLLEQVITQAAGVLSEAGELFKAMEHKNRFSKFKEKLTNSLVNLMDGLDYVVNEGIQTVSKYVSSAAIGPSWVRHDKAKTEEMELFDVALRRAALPLLSAMEQLQAAATGLGKAQQQVKILAREARQQRRMPTILQNTNTDLSEEDQALKTVLEAMLEAMLEGQTIGGKAATRLARAEAVLKERLSEALLVADTIKARLNGAAFMGEVLAATDRMSALSEPQVKVRQKALIPLMAMIEPLRQMTVELGGIAGQVQAVSGGKYTRAAASLACRAASFKRTLKQAVTAATGRPLHINSRDGMLAKGMGELIKAMSPEALASVDLEELITEIFDEELRHRLTKAKDPQGAMMASRFALGVADSVRNILRWPPTPDEILTGTKTLFEHMLTWSERKLIVTAIFLGVKYDGNTQDLIVNLNPLDHILRPQMRYLKTLLAPYFIAKGVRKMKKGVRLGQPYPDKAIDQYIRREVYKYAFNLISVFMPDAVSYATAVALTGIGLYRKPESAAKVVVRTLTNLPLDMFWTGGTYGANQIRIKLLERSALAKIEPILQWDGGAGDCDKTHVKPLGHADAPVLPPPVSHEEPLVQGLQQDLDRASPVIKPLPENDSQSDASPVEIEKRVKRSAPLDAEHSMDTELPAAGVIASSDNEWKNITTLEWYLQKKRPEDADHIRSILVSESNKKLGKIGFDPLNENGADFLYDNMKQKWYLCDERSIGKYVREFLFPSLKLSPSEKSKNIIEKIFTDILVKTPSMSINNLLRNANNELTNLFSDNYQGGSNSLAAEYLEAKFYLLRSLNYGDSDSAFNAIKESISKKDLDDKKLLQKYIDYLHLTTMLAELTSEPGVAVDSGRLSDFWLTKGNYRKMPVEINRNKLNYYFMTKRVVFEDENRLKRLKAEIASINRKINVIRHKIVDGENTVENLQRSLDALMEFRGQLTDDKTTLQQGLENHRKEYKIHEEARSLLITLDSDVYNDLVRAGGESITERRSRRELMWAKLEIMELTIRNGTSVYTDEDLDEINKLNVARAMLFIGQREENALNNIISQYKNVVIHRNYKKGLTVSNLSSAAEDAKSTSINFRDEEFERPLLVAMIYFAKKYGVTLNEIDDAGVIWDNYFKDKTTLVFHDFVGPMPAGYTPLSAMLDSDCFAVQTDYTAQFNEYISKGYADYEAKLYIRDLMINSGVDMTTLSQPAKKIIRYGLGFRDSKQVGELVFIQMHDGRWLFISMIPGAHTTKVFTDEEMENNKYLKALKNRTKDKVPEKLITPSGGSMYGADRARSRWDDSVIGQNALECGELGRREMLISIQEKVYKDVLFKDTEFFQTFDGNNTDYFHIVDDNNSVTNLNDHSVISAATLYMTDVQKNLAGQNKVTLYKPSGGQKFAFFILPFYQEVYHSLTDSEYKVDLSSIVIDAINVATVVTGSLSKIGVNISRSFSVAMKSALKSGHKLSLTGKALARHILVNLKDASIISAQQAAKGLAAMAYDILEPFPIKDLMEGIRPFRFSANHINNISQVPGQSSEFPSSLHRADIDLNNVRPREGVYEISTQTESGVQQYDYYIKQDEKVYQVRRDEESNTWGLVGSARPRGVGYVSPIKLEAGRWKFNANIDDLEPHDNQLELNDFVAEVNLYTSQGPFSGLNRTEHTIPVNKASTYFMEQSLSYEKIQLYSQDVGIYLPGDRFNVVPIAVEGISGELSMSRENLMAYLTDLRNKCNAISTWLDNYKGADLQELEYNLRVLEGTIAGVKNSFERMADNGNIKIHALIKEGSDDQRIYGFISTEYKNGENTLEVSNLFSHPYSVINQHPLFRSHLLKLQLMTQEALRPYHIRNVAKVLGYRAIENVLAAHAPIPQSPIDTLLFYSESPISNNIGQTSKFYIDIFSEPGGGLDIESWLWNTIDTNWDYNWASTRIENSYYAYRIAYQSYSANEQNLSHVDQTVRDQAKRRREGLIALVERANARYDADEAIFRRIEARTIRNASDLAYSEVTMLKPVEPWPMLSEPNMKRVILSDRRKFMVDNDSVINNLNSALEDPNLDIDTRKFISNTMEATDKARDQAKAAKNWFDNARGNPEIKKQLMKFLAESVGLSDNNHFTQKITDIEINKMAYERMEQIVNSTHAVLNNIVENNYAGIVVAKTTSGEAPEAYTYKEDPQRRIFVIKALKPHDSNRLFCTILHEATHLAETSSMDLGYYYDTRNLQSHFPASLSSSMRQDANILINRETVRFLFGDNAINNNGIVSNETMRKAAAILATNKLVKADVLLRTADYQAHLIEKLSRGDLQPDHTSFRFLPSRATPSEAISK